MALISEYARRKKLEHFLGKLTKDAVILEVGCADGWVGRYARKLGFKNFTELDILPYENANIVGDINSWERLGMKEASYDAIIAFEVIEHGDFYKAFYALLKPQGKLFVTTPLPHMDWLCKVLEFLKLNQKRSSGHTHLIYLKDIPKFKLTEYSVKGFMSQWGELTKTV